MVESYVPGLQVLHDCVYMSALISVCNVSWANGANSAANILVFHICLGQNIYVYLFTGYIYTGWAGYKTAVFYPGAQWLKYVYN